MQNICKKFADKGLYTTSAAAATAAAAPAAAAAGPEQRLVLPEEQQQEESEVYAINWSDDDDVEVDKVDKCSEAAGQ